MKELVDIRTVKVDTSLPMEQRKNEYVNQIKDPNHFKYDDMEVCLSFSNNGVTLQDCISLMVNS